MTDQAVVAGALQNLLGPGFGIGVTDPAEAGGDLWPQETAAVAKAVRKRRLEFTAGRVAARQAMAELGLPPQPVLQAPDRAPLWPAGMIGSIAHCDKVCIAAIAQSGTARSIGIDVEPDSALPADLEHIICTPNERRWLDRQPLDDRNRLTKLIFSSKESLYKAQYPLTGEIIGFEVVEIQPDLARHSFLALPSNTSALSRLEAHSSGQFAFAGGYILTCCRML